ncbi:hypothetical protein BDW22DRAFT_1360844 [Trametopsis cervina]|nr:hypothetical protein BDW22DRAFT_1360844 [Trametopsis cervina]
MSTAIEHKTKKRKHASAEVTGEPSTKRSKTGKEKKEKHSSEKKESKKEGKGKAPADGQFRVIKATLAVSIPPIFAGRPREGAEEMLDSLVMRYVPAFQGVLLAHDSLRFLSSTATIKGDSPFANCSISFDATVWSPRIGMKLAGKVNLCSPDHVSLLVHRTFNVSIPRQHIPTDNWEFEYGPADNDPEFGEESMELNATASASETVEGSGRWVHKITGEKLGGEEGLLGFTVIGLTIANQMLSLVGSIQHDPFSPELLASQPNLTTTSRRQSGAVHPVANEDADPIEEQGESDDEVDTFDTLARIQNTQPVAVESDPKQRDADDERKERKRKRKAEKEAARAADGEGKPEKKKKKKQDLS